jgi:ankyrin repeat protein
MKETTQEEFNEFLSAIAINDGNQVVKLAETNPGLLKWRDERRANAWILVGNSPKVEPTAVEAVAIAAYKNSKNIGGYDSFFSAQDVEGNTAIQIAVKTRQNTHAQLLVNMHEKLLRKVKGPAGEAEVQKRVADLMNMRDSKGRTVLHNFLGEDVARTLELIQFFASKGADFNVLDKDGSNPGLVQCKFMLEAATRYSGIRTALEAFTLINLFVANGANPDQPNQKGETLISIGQKNSTGWNKDYTSDLRKNYQEFLSKKGQQAPVSSRSSSRQDESPSSSRSESTPPPSSGKSTPPSSSRSESTPPPVVGPRTAALEKEKAQKQDQVGKSGCCSIL